MLYVLIAVVLAVALNRLMNKLVPEQKIHPRLDKKTILLLLLIVNFLDWWTTKIALSMGGLEESNPVLRMFIEVSPEGWDIYKLIYWSLVLFFMSFLVPRRPLLAITLVLILFLLINGIIIATYLIK
ncbi:MAG: DUF5658 family protein [Patescibacteria group bacterium]